MPELPEVETIKNDLKALVRGRRIERVEVRDPSVVRLTLAEDFARDLKGEEIVDITRRAKYLLIALSSGRFLVVHLVLTGQLLLVEPQTPLKSSVRLIFWLDDGRQLRLVDRRHFARMYLVEPEQLNTDLHLDELGPEPLSRGFTPTVLAERLAGRSAAIKTVLLNQRVIAGLGNIYADEVLFRARIHPLQPTNQLTTEDIARLYEAIRETLREAISYRGTSTQAYRDVRGRKGSYQDHLLVHSRAGRPCEGCRGNVEKMVVSGRGTYLCSSCQILSKAS